MRNTSIMERFSNLLHAVSASVFGGIVVTVAFRLVF
jgi:hypothetical protein